MRVLLVKKAYDRRKEWKKRNPWARLVEHARRRCNPKSDDPRWKTYRENGTYVKLTAKELKVVWERDKAHLLKRPSLDRIDPTKHYTADNVRIIEFDLNARMAWDPSACVPAPENYPPPEFV